MNSEARADTGALPTASRMRVPEPVVRFVSSRSGFVATMLLVIVVGSAYLLPPLLGLQPDVQLSGARLLSPSLGHPFGTDEFGRDLLARCLQGVQISLQIGAAAALVGGVVGTLAGYAAGYFGAIVDSVLMRIVDAMLAFPNILLAIVVVAVLGTGLKNIALALAITNIPIFARLARASIMGELSREYIVAARSVGASPWRLVFRHAMPNTLPPLVVQIGLAMAFAVLGEAGLSYVGLGVQPPTASLGSILATGQVYMLSGATYYVILPAFVLAALLFGLNLSADAVNDVSSRRSAQY